MPILHDLFHALSLKRPGRQSSLAAQSHALLEAIGDGALAGSGSLGESCRATKGTGGSTVPDANNADVVGTADRGVAGHVWRHLNSHGEVGVGGQRKTLDTEAGNILCHLRILESIGVSPSGSAIDGGLKRAGAILVDLRDSQSARAGEDTSVETYLAEDHADLTGVRSSGQTVGTPEAGSVGHHGLWTPVVLITTTTEESTKAATTPGTAAEEVSDLTLACGSALTGTVLNFGDVILHTDRPVASVVGRDGSGAVAAHEVGNHDRGVNGAVALSAAERSRPSTAHIAVAYDGCVGLRAAAVGGAVTRSTIGD